MKWVYTFEEGSKDNTHLLGGKGANLAEMVNQGLPVPPGFIITTEASKQYLRDQKFPPGLWEQVKGAIHELENTTGRSFSSSNDSPLTVSVRSGAAISMPGMLETILNVGLTSQRAKYLEELSGQQEYVRDSFERLIQLFARVVYNHDLDLNPSVNGVRQLLRDFQVQLGEPFPQDPYVQLQRAIAAVFNSWLSPKATEYRKSYHVSDDLGTAVVIQTMVFGNMGSDSGTGVVFSRNPATGEKQLFGEYLPNAQGEEIVSGSRTPETIEILGRTNSQVYRQLEDICNQLEKIYRDVQDVEFTIERGKLWILQTRAAKRTPMATVKVAVDMVDEGILSKEAAIERVDPSIVSQVLSPRLEDASPENAVAQGIASSPGAAVGRIVLNREQVQKLASSGDPLIFVRESISPDDVPLMPLIAGILTREGGATSHAAVVARGLGKPCVVGCSELQIDFESNTIHIRNDVIPQGSFISIDGSAGLVYIGRKNLTGVDLRDFNELNILLEWADEITEGKPQVFVNANSPSEVELAGLPEKKTKAIGLCRTEWMFYDTSFRLLFREALLTESDRRKKEALQELEKRQAREFESIFTYASGKPVIVRLLAAPLDDFFPVRDTVVTELAELRLSQGWNEAIGHKEQLLYSISAQQHVNPSFGARGVKLFIVKPELAKMQIRALFEGVGQAFQRSHTTVRPMILLPNVSAAAEVSLVVEIIKDIAGSVMQKNAMQFSYQVGVLLETPRAALIAGEIAPLVDFMCIGTDGLTETTFGYAREDSNKFIPMYTSENLLPGDPMIWFDVSGVGALIQQAVQQVRQTRPNMLFGVIGAHIDNADAIRLFTRLGLDYVSVDPSHSLNIRLALAQAKIASN